jgi:two-component system chemotaxis response regulator CheB
MTALSDQQPTRLIVIGTSLGGLSVLRTLVSGFKPEIKAAILIVQHIGPHQSRLSELLQTVCRLPVRFAVDKEPLREGHILIAPPDFHLIAHQAHVRLMHTAKENYARPAIDPLFRSAAAQYLSTVIGVVLSGDLDDGTNGLQAIKDGGGIAIVQDPDTAVAPSMPKSALRYVDVDHCLPVEEIALKLTQLVSEPVPAQQPTISRTTMVDNLFADGKGSEEELDGVGKRSMFSCPECHGNLWEMDDSRPMRFRCHTGHSYTQRHLEFAQNEALEETLWSSIRALQEKHQLYKQLQQSAYISGRTFEAQNYAEQATQMLQDANRLKELSARLRVICSEFDSF